MATIYLVHGSRGEYSDRSEWVAAAFATEEEAKAFVLECEEAVSTIVRPFAASQRLWRYDNDPSTYDAQAKAAQALMPDPALTVDSYDADDARYWLVAIALGRPARFGSADEPLEDIDHANANLMAASPDLYAAACAAETVMMIVEPRSAKAEYLAALAQLRAALAKTRGDTTGGRADGR